MTALATTNITTTLVDNALGSGTHAVFGLCTSANINKWSKYKPVTGTWPAGTSGKYGLNLPTNWNYVAITTDARLGDFRGYEHDQSAAYPPIQSRDADKLIRTLNPTGTPADNTLLVRIDNTTSSVRIIPADLGYDGYYFGVAIQIEAGQWHYKTYGQVSNGTIDGDIIQLIAYLEKTNSTWAYRDLPYGEGTYSFELYISSEQDTTWTTSTPANYIKFPSGTVNGGALICEGSFEVLPWLMCDPYTIDFAPNAVYGDIKEVDILSGVQSHWDIESDGSKDWYEIKVWDVSSAQYFTNPTTWQTNIMKIHIMYLGDQGNGTTSGDATFTTPGGGSANLHISHSDPWVPPTTDVLVNNGESFTLEYNNSSSTEYEIYIEVGVENWSSTPMTMYFEAYRGATLLCSGSFNIRNYGTNQYTGGGIFAIDSGAQSGASGQHYDVYLMSGI